MPFLVTTAVLVAGASVAGAAPPQYRATVLPQIDTTDDPFALTFTTPFAMNNDRVITGSLGDGMGFVWSPGGGAYTLQPIVGTGFSRAVGTSVNNAGVIVGTGYPKTTPGSLPFMVDAEGAVTILPTLIPEFGAGAGDVNDAGMIVGSAETGSGGTFGGPSTSVYWENGQIHEIGGFGGNYSVAVAINNHGVVVGQANAEPFAAARAYRWTQDGGFEPLGAFIEGMPTLVSDINDAGIVVGHGAVSPWENAPVYWDAEGVVHELPRLDPGAIDIDVRAVNNHNVMVGFELVSDTFVPEARLWLDGEVYDLNELVVGLPEGMLLRDAVDINDHGDIAAEAQIEIEGQLEFIAVLLTADEGCAADWDGDGAASVRDLIAYLSDFHAQDADIDGDGATDVNDLVGFLGMFNAGC